MATTSAPDRTVGELLRGWRNSRRMSQLDLSAQTGISTRHLSFVETGRARPSPQLILKLAEELDVPLAERNTMLLAGGYAPAYRNHHVDDPRLATVRDAARQILAGHGPYPAVLIDHHWHLVEANPAIELFTAGARPDLLTPPVNVLRLSLHPAGMAPRIANLAQWRAHLLDRLRRQATATGDPALHHLYEELGHYPGGDRCGPPDGADAAGVVVPLRYRHHDRELSFISTTTVFGTPLDVTVAGLAIEAFFPADATTAQTLRALSPIA